MFEIVPEPEFEAWYAGLDEPLAEEVTATLDLVAAAGSTLMPERLSRLLLWYDGVGDGSSSRAFLELARRYHATDVVECVEAVEAMHGARDYLEWRQEIVLALESSAFQKRLGRLSAELAEQALVQVERLKRKLKSTRIVAALNPPLSPAENGLQRDFLQLLELLGLDPGALFGSGSGLRELSITSVEPGLRVLVALDFPERRLLAILGESLDRRYYGDSVKRAEARWKHYLERSSSQKTVRR